VHPVGSYCTNISRCTVHKTLKKYCMEINLLIPAKFLYTCVRLIPLSFVHYWQVNSSDSFQERDQRFMVYLQKVSSLDDTTFDGTVHMKYWTQKCCSSLKYIARFWREDLREFIKILQNSQTWGIPSTNHLCSPSWRRGIFSKDDSCSPTNALKKK